MKKNIVFIIFLLLQFLFLTAIFSFGSNTEKNHKPVLTIVLNDKGEKIEESGEKKSFYDKGDEIHIFIEERSTYYYSGERTEEKVESENIPIFGIQKIDTKEVVRPLKFAFTLSKRGVKYRLKITRYDTEDDKLKKTNGAVIFNETYQTHKRYSLGLYIGIYFPSKPSDEYEIGYRQSTDNSPSIIKNSTYEVKTMFFISLYPFGFEPDKKISSKNFFKRFHLNVGSEISDSLFKNWYFGAGYSFGKYLSLDIFMKYGKVDQLRTGFTEGEIDPEKITIVPLDHEYKASYGLSLSFSFNFASVLGKFFGL